MKFFLLPVTIFWQHFGNVKMSLTIFWTLFKLGYLCHSANLFFSLSAPMRQYCTLIEFDSFFIQVYPEVSNLWFLSSKKRERNTLGFHTLYSFFFYSQIQNKENKACYRQDCSAAGGKIDRTILSVGQMYISKDEMKEGKLVTTTAIPATESIFHPNN